MIIPELTHGGDVLLIVPPYAMTNYQSLGVHILQGVGRRAGFKVDVFYGNIHFAAHLGEIYPRFCEAGPYLPGERSFAGAAWGLDDEALSIQAPFDERAQIFYPPSEKLTPREIEETGRAAREWIDSLRESFREMNYSMVGITSSYEQVNAAFALFKAIKAEAPGCITTLGGYSAEGVMAEGIASLDPEGEILDYIFSGESEHSFVSFMETLKKGESPASRIIRGQALESMDDLPPLDYREYFDQLEKYLPGEFQKGSAQIAMESSRGCWWGEKSHCLFCGYSDERLKFREKSPEKFLGELESMEGKEYPSSYGHMADLIMPKAHFDCVIPALAEKESSWTLYYEQRAAWNRNQLEGMGRAGIRDNQPGIETLSTSLLQLMGKGSTLKKNLIFLREATGSQIKLYWNIVWGFPGESMEEYRKMTELVPLITHLIPPVGIFKLALSRFSPLFENPQKWGIRNIRPLPAYREVFPSRADLNTLAYYFISDYEAQTFDHPEVMDRFTQSITRWNHSWQNAVTQPRLLLAPSGTDGLILLDTRGLGHPVKTGIDEKKAARLLAEAPYDHSKLQTWALDHDFALIINNEFIPLVTVENTLRKELIHDQRAE